LTSDYRYIKNFKLPGENSDADIIVIGPQGVFFVEVKNYRGIFKSYGNNIYNNAKKYKVNEYIYKNARRKSFNLHELILKKTGRDIFVRAMITFSDVNSVYSQELFKGINNKGAIIIQAKYLSKNIMERNNVLNFGDIDKVHRSFLEM